MLATTVFGSRGEPSARPGGAPTTDCDPRPEITAMSMLRGFNRKTHAPTDA
jgi:hypothetical protein